MKTGFIDWTDGELYLYTFIKKGGQLTLEDTSSIPFEGESDERSLAGIATAGIHDLYLSLPAAFLSLRELDFPFSDEKKISDTIAFELEGLLLGDTAEYNIDHIVTESFDDSSKVLAVCIEKTKLDNIIKTFASAGLEPKIITSLDIRLNGNNYERILQGEKYDRDRRAESVKDELLLPSINLRKGEFSFKGDIERLIKISRFTAFLFLVLLIILGLDSTLNYRSLSREHSILNSEVQRSFHSVFPEDTTIVDVSRQFKGNVNIIKKKKDILGGVRVLDILKDITDLTDGLAELNEFRADGKNIIVKGTVPSFKDVELLKNFLSASFGNVSVTESTSTIDNKVSFTIVMRERAS